MEVEPLYNEEEVTKIKEKMVSDGVKHYPLMSIKDIANNKVNSYRRLLFFVNIPLIFAIPIALETGLLDKVHSEKVDSTYIALQMADFFFCFNSILIYSTLKRVVSSVEYLPDEHKL